jgi:AsmA protein
MKRLGRWLAVIAAVAAVLVIAAIILVKVLVTPERIRATVLPLAEKALHRPVALGDIQIGFFSGVQLADLRIAEPEGKETFVAADKMVLRYRFWPLLLGRVMIDQAQLVGPRIRVVRAADGRFNFDDLLGKPSPAQPAAGGEPPGAVAGPIDLHISHVGISGGEVVFLDYAVDSQAPYRLKFSAVDLSLKDVSLTRGFPFELRGMLNDAQLAISGEANLQARSGKFQVQLTDLDATGFAPYLRGRIPGTLGALKVSADLEVAGDAKQVTSSGQLTLANLAVTLDALPKTPLRNVNLKLDYALNLDLTNQQLAIDKGHLDFNGIQADVTGAVNNYARNPRLDLQLALPGLDLRQALDALPPGLVAKTDGLDLAGKIDLQVHLVGSPQHPADLPQEGSLKLTSVQASLAGLRPALNGLLNLKGKAVTSQGLQLVAGDNRADLDLHIADLTARPLGITASLSADQLTLDPLLGAAAPAKGGGTGSAAAPAGKRTEPGPLDLPLHAEASLKVKKATFKGLTCQGLVLHGLLAKNVLTIDDLHGQLVGGSFNDTARIDLGQPGFSYRTHLVLKGLQFEPLVAAFAPKSGATLTGGLDLDADLAGKGTLPEAVKRSLSGKGEFVVKDGRLEGGQLVQGLAAILALDDLRQLSFQQWAGNFQIDQGQVRFASRFSGRQVRLAPQGTIGLDGKLDLLLDTRLAPELTARLDSGGKVTSYFKDADGWGQVPLKLGGSLDKPRFEIDARAAVQKVGEKLQQKFLERLEPKKGSGPSPDTAPKQQLEKTLRGLFGN